ncbi:MAG: cytochrome oxidase assembly protein [Ilumatobacter sp.]|nr:cytochrome oxidase assembly protein [Ilumatobacter sp.]
MDGKVVERTQHTADASRSLTAMAALRDVTRYRQLAILTTVGVCLLTVAGGIVRLTGSGLGCDDWPNCNSERFVDVSSGHAAIEQVNRLLSGVIGVPTLLLAISAFRVRPRVIGLRWPAIGVLVSVLANGVVGGVAVRTDLHPGLVQSHFLLAMVSVAFGIVAVHRSSSSASQAGRTTSWRSQPGQLTALLTSLTAVALVTGTVVTGTGPHAGEQNVRRFGFDISNVARIHSATVITALAVAGLLAWTLRSGADSEAGVRAALSGWIFVGLLQSAVGYTQYFNGVPELLVGTHIALATGLWVMTMRLLLMTIETRQPECNTKMMLPTAARV